MLGRLRNSFAEVDLGALEQNYLSLQGALKPGGGSCLMAPMVKADAYGHGDIQVARVCEKLGARFLGVALIEEGIKLRLGGIQAPILVFAPFDSVGAEALVRYRLTPILSQFEQIGKLKTAISEHAGYPVHVKFNTGMQRLGFEPADAVAVGRMVGEDPFFKLEGVCTHFASSEDVVVKNGATQEQIKIFQKIMSDMKPHFQNQVLFHYLNSAGILSGLEPKLDLARPGIALYGAMPKLQTESRAAVQPVMSVKSQVAFTHKVKKGAKVSYGGTWTAPKDSLIAVVPVGYADGIPRLLSNKGRALVKGASCPIAGIVCMDYLMLDVTLTGAQVGDEVVFIGKQKNEMIRVEEVAETAQTIPYEILTGMQSRLPRVYIH